MRSLLSFALAMLTASACAAATYNPFLDFSSTQGPVWRFGYAASGSAGSIDSAFTNLPTYTPSCLSTGGGSLDCWVGSSSIVKPSATFGYGSVAYTDGYLNMHPGSGGELAVVSFTAPVDATYSFAGWFKDQDVDGGNGVDLAIVLGPSNSYLLGPTAASAQFSPVEIDFSQSLTAGQSVYFVLGSSGEYSYDSVGLALTVNDGLSGVPEPATFVMAGVALGLIQVVRRRRSATTPAL